MSCPVHGETKWRDGKKPGSKYCSAMVNGEYCTWKANAAGRRYQFPKPSEAPESGSGEKVATAGSQAPSSPLREAAPWHADKGYQDLMNWNAALNFAGDVFKGTGKAAEALELAAAARALLP